MDNLKQKWDGLALASRTSLIVGLLFIVAMMALLGWWAYRPDYQVLFADLAPRDAAAMTAELDKLKTPYQLGDGGNSILVPRDLVYKTRLKLMGKEVPLHGAVGFEVFNNADFGMTEFVQKVNYQRAIQGELTRTILAIDEIQSARVHLAIPEQGLFKKSASKSKGSVTLTMKPGQTLSAEQVTGIQRLVAASVPDIAAADVTVLDQHGTALTRVAASDAAQGEGASGQLDAKRGTEDYLVKKVTQVLDRTFGAGAAIASVDVSLNLDQRKITTEDVLPAHAAKGDAASAGVVVRERHTINDGDAVGGTLGSGGAKPASASGSTVSEADYQVGRRVEQLVVASGGVRRMTVAVVVKNSLNEDQLAKLREVVGLAIGLNEARGDALVVHSMDRLTSSAPVVLPAMTVADPADTAAPVPQASPNSRISWTLVALLALALVMALVVLLLRRRVVLVQPPVLDAAARERLLADVRSWIEVPAGAAAPVPVAVRK